MPRTGRPRKPPSDDPKVNAVRAYNHEYYRYGPTGRKRTGRKRIRDKDTREWATTISKGIDDEPTPKAQQRFRVGEQCWFIANYRWYLVKVVERPENRIRIQSLTGWDSKREAEWPHIGDFEFSSVGTYFPRLRKLGDHQP